MGREADRLSGKLGGKLKTVLQEGKLKEADRLAAMWQEWKADRHVACR